MFRTDTFRLIRKTFKRFLSLTLIVMIGSGFMMGLMSSPRILRQSVDAYDDREGLQDLQIYSQYGFCFDDYIALKKAPEVKEIFASRMLDIDCYDQLGEKFVARVNEMYRTVNRIHVIEGRMPEREDECLVLEDELGRMGFSIGDRVRLEKDDLDEYLKNDEFTIVGYAASPEYICKFLGVSNLNNQDIQVVFYIPNSNFISDYYTTVFLTIEGAEDTLSYTAEYDEYMSEHGEGVENVAFEQQNYLKNQIKDRMADEIERARKEFEKQKKEGQEQLDEAGRKLDQANIQIATYETEMQSLEMIIARLKSLVDDHSDTIGEIQDEINEANYYAEYIIDEFNIDPSIFHIQQVRNMAIEALEKAKTEYGNLKYQIRAARAQYEAGLKEYTEAVLDFNDEIKKAEAELRKAEQDLEDLPKAKWTVLERDSHYSSYMFDNTCRQMNSVGISLPFLFFLVAALVCLTTMKRLVDEQRGQIGIFVALGFSKLQIIGKYVSYALLAAFIGCLLGIIFGQLVFTTVIYRTWRLMYVLPEMELTFPPGYVLICLAAFALLISVITAYVVYNSLNEVPAALMRPKAPKNAKKIILEKISLIWDRLSFTSKITARNLFRYKSRFLMTVLGVAGCTALLVTGWGIKDSISDIIQIQYGEIFNYDYQIYLDSPHHADENIDLLRENFDNEEVVKYLSYTTKVYLDKDDDTANMIVIDPRDAYIIFDLRATDKTTPLKLNNDGVIISEKFAHNNNIHKGDFIVLESESGLKAEVRVASICEMYFQHYIFMSNAVYQNCFDETPEGKIIAVKTHDPERLVSDAENLTDFLSIVDFSSMIDQFETMIRALDLIILVVIITAGSLAFVVLVNITQVNISERVREIATLKVLGFNELEIDLYIFKEILLLTLIGGLLGLPLGILEHHFIMNVINMEMMMFGMNISLYSFARAFLLTFVFTGIVLFFMRKPLNRISMVESLKSVE